MPNQGAFPEFVSSANGGVLLESCEPKGVAQAWAELLSSPEKLKKLSVNARIHAEREFNEKTISNKIVDLLGTKK
jgi:glycosyltransferase involved in cell wall biosynthesis